MYNLLTLKNISYNKLFYKINNLDRISLFFCCSYYIIKSSESQGKNKGGMVLIPVSFCEEDVPKYNGKQKNYIDS